MRAHIFHDDKFTDDIISNIIRYGGGDDKFYIWRRPASARSFVQSADCRWIDEFELQDKSLLGEIGNASLVVFHFLKGRSVHLLELLPRETTIVWAFWGADGYSLPKLKGELYDEQTERMLRSLARFPTIASCIKFIVESFRSTWQTKLGRQLGRIDYVATWVDGDYLKLKRHYQIRASVIPFANFSVEQLYSYEVPALETPKHNGPPRLLLGNSGDPSNNHLSILHLLRHTEFEIVCPLSYGTQPRYIQEVCKTGSTLYGSRFIPLIDFMEKKAYLKLLESIDVFVFNHQRQQAVSNTFVPLLMGKMLFMNSKSSLLETYLRWGMRVFTTDQILSAMDFSEEDRTMNRKILLDKLGEDTVKKYYRRLLDLGK